MIAWREKVLAGVFKKELNLKESVTAAQAEVMDFKVKLMFYVVRMGKFRSR